MGGGVALLARGIWWRRGASLVLVLCAAVTVSGAAAGPLWGRASQASLLQRAVQEAGVSELAWTAVGTTDNYGGLTYPPPSPSTVVSDVAIRGKLPPELSRLFDEPTQKVSTIRRLQVTVSPTERPSLGVLVGREGACEQLELAAGSCPRLRTDLLLSDRSAELLGVEAGQEILLPELDAEPPPRGQTENDPYVVSGVYRADSIRADSRFWFDSEDFELAPPVTVGGEALPARLDAVLVLPETLLALQNTGVRVQTERVLRPGVITLANADRVARQLSAQAVEVAGTSRVVDATASAASTIAGTVRGRQLVADTATFVGLQVVVFGLVVLFGLVAVSVAARDAELALAKLRGLRGRRLAAHALTEPVALVLLAVPLGLAGAAALVTVAARRVLLPGTPITVPPELAWTVAATVAGAVLACALATRRSVRMPVADQLRRQRPQAASAAAQMAGAVLLTLAAVGLVLVLTLGRDAQAALPALLTPVVVGLAAGVVVGRAVRALLGAAAARTRRWPLGPYLAVRQLARQASLTHTTALVTVATAVSGFAAGAYVVTATQREAQARLDVGAERVVHVAPARAGDLIAATERADPQGGWAMAAVQRGEGAETVLAVDSPRFGAAFGVPGGALAGGGLGALSPADVPEPLAVRGDSATLVVGPFVRAANELGTVNGADVEIAVQLRVVDPEGAVSSAVLGRLGPDAARLTAPLPGCAQGCTVSSLYLLRTAGPAEISGTVDFVALEIGGSRYPFSSTEWRPALVDESRPDSATTSSIQGGASQGGVTATFAAPPSITPGLVRRDRPTVLPAILGAGTNPPLLGARYLVKGSTFEGNELPYAVAGRTPAVPRSGEGAVLDLDLLSRIDPPRSSGLDFQVWLGPGAPPDAPQRLAAAGLRVLEVESRADRRTALDRSEPARAQLLLLAAGAAVLLAGVAGIATVLAAAARRRAAEAAALHAMAVPGRVVRGSAVLEDVLLLVPGILAGAACAAALVTALTPVLAEVSGAAAVVSGLPPLTDVLPPVSAAAAVTALLLVPVVLLVTRPAGDETPLRDAT